MKRFIQQMTPALLLALFAWFAIANLVFAFRHPWATSTERFLYLGKALTFKKVSYHDARR